MNIEIINSLKQRAKEMLENNYNRKIGDEEVYTIICELENFYTAYEKEKEERERIGKLYYGANENCIKYEKMIKKEKEKNKNAIDFINDKNNYFEDGENWQNVLKIKKILGG